MQLITNYKSEYKDRLFEVVTSALNGGCEIIQFSWAGDSDLTTYKHAEKLRRLTADYGAKLIVNNRIDMALVVSADGVWIGQKDLPYTAVKQMISKSMTIGFSIPPLSASDDLMADSFGIGHVFDSKTKPAEKDDIVGLEGVKKARMLTRKHITAIGGINLENAELVMNAGANELAVIGAVYSSKDIAKTVKKLVSIEQSYKNQEGVINLIRGKISHK